MPSTSAATSTVAQTRTMDAAGVGAAALAASVMLVMDAWFYVMTTGAGADMASAVGLAVGLNLPLAAGAAWYSRRVLRGHLRLSRTTKHDGCCEHAHS